MADPLCLMIASILDFDVEQCFFRKVICKIFFFMSQNQCQPCEFPTLKVVADEEFLPFPQNTFDLVVSSLRYAFEIKYYKQKIIFI